MAGLRRPALYRASRYVSIAATVVAILILLYVGASVYSASQFRPGKSGGTNIEQSVSSQGFQFTTNVNFTNPGFLPIDAVHLSSIINAPNNTSLLARGSSPNVSLAPATVGQVPLTLLIPFTGSAAAMALLTHDGDLPTIVWANVTFGHVFVISVEIPTTVHWGAPFNELSIALGLPSSANGTTTVPVTLSFVNDAPFALDGSLALTLAPPTGSGCSVSMPPFALAVAPHSSEAATQSITIPNGCSYPSGSMIGGSYSSGSWSATLPSQVTP